jgi:hypothetical protein
VPRRALPAFAAIDFLSCLLVVFVAVALTSKPPEVKTYGAYAVVMTWPKGANDVDLYLRDPAGNTCYYRQLQAGQMQLEHDDLGKGSTNYGSGARNEERTVIRGTAAGQYVVGVHMYFRAGGSGPVPVQVDLWNLQGGDRLLKTREVYLMKTGDERTPFRFTIGPGGRVTGFSELPVSLVTPDTAYTG